MRDAEWFTGARTGASDQGAMILGRRGALVNLAMLAEDLDTSAAQYLVLPDELRVLIINSYTQRSLSGAQLAAYTRNRFAYSMALEILRQELRAMGHRDTQTARLDRLSRITPEALGGSRALYKVLLRIPDELTPDEMRKRFDLPDFDQAYERYFGGVPPEHRPNTIGLRGPLIFGLAESERARAFLPALERGDFALAGRLMTIGHNGDRIVNPDGTPFNRSLPDTEIQRLTRTNTPILECPGDYGASSPVLDTLVDTAISAGALGASLTGAGIAGAVLALCHREDADKIAESIRHRIAAQDYTTLSKRSCPLSEEELTDAVMVNHAPESAGELICRARRARHSIICPPGAP